MSAFSAHFMLRGKNTNELAVIKEAAKPPVINSKPRLNGCEAKTTLIR